MTTLIEYNREIQPKIKKLIELQEALKEWKAEDDLAREYVAEIKTIREALKSHIEDKESNLLREINDLKTDIKLAIDAAVNGTEYKAKDLKAYLVARATEKVEAVVAKAAIFEELEGVLA